MKILLPETELQGIAGSGEQTAPQKRPLGAACGVGNGEDFAPRNGAERVSEERGANRASEIAAGGSLRRGKCVKILLPETELQGIAGRGEQTAP